MADDPFAEFEAVDASEGDEFAQFQPSTSELADPESFDSFSEHAISPIELAQELDEDSLVEDLKFSPVMVAAENTELVLNNPDLADKLISVYDKKNKRGTTVGEKAAAAAEALPEVGKSVARGAVGLAERAVTLFPPVIALRAVSHAVQGKPIKDLTADVLKETTEVAASLETSMAGSVDLLRRGGRAFTGQPEEANELRSRFFDDVAFFSQTEKSARGEGAALQGGAVEQLRKEGVELDFQAINDLSLLTDPVNFIPFGGAVVGVTKNAGKLVAKTGTAVLGAQRAARVAEALNKARDLTAAGAKATAGVTGAGLKRAGGRVTRVAKVLEKQRSQAGLLGAGVLGGAVAGGVMSPGVAAGIAVLPSLFRAGGGAVSSVGRAMRGEASRVADWAANTRGVLVNPWTKGAALGTAEGTVLSVPFVIGARPEEEGAILGAGVGLGAVGGVIRQVPSQLRSAHRSLIGRLTRQVEQKSVESVPYGTDGSLDSAHATQMNRLDEKERNLVNAYRERLRDLFDNQGVDLEIYAVDSDTFESQSGNRTANGFYQVLEPAGGRERKVFRILLNESPHALTHEAYHALKTVLPEDQWRGFEDSVSQGLTPEQLQEFSDLYNAALNQGLPRDQWTARLTPEQVIEEVSAEAASQILQGRNIENIAPTVVQRGIGIVAGMLENLGFDTSGVGAEPGPGVTELGVRPSAAQASALTSAVGAIEALPQVPSLQRFAELEARGQMEPGRVPTVSFEGAGPTSTPASGPVAPAPAVLNENARRALRNLRSIDQLEQILDVVPGDEAGIAQARAFLENNPQVSAEQRAVGNAVLDNVGRAVELEFLSARGEQPVIRRRRRGETEATREAELAGALPEDLRDLVQKSTIPYRVEINVGTRGADAGKPIFTVLAASPDKVVNNASILASQAAEKGILGRVPYATTPEGRFTEAGLRTFLNDLRVYSQNHANGYAGDGSVIRIPDNYEGFVPPQNANYRPTPLPVDAANFINMAMGTPPPKTTKRPSGATARRVNPITGAEIQAPANIEAQRLAEASGRPALPSKISVDQKVFKDYATGIAEFNPMRNEFVEAGVDVRNLAEEFTERIRLDKVKAVRPTPTAPIQAAARPLLTQAGFQPGRIANPAEVISRVATTEDPVAFRALMDRQEGGLTGYAVDLGLSLTERAQLQSLLDQAAAASARSKELMKAGDFDTAMAIVSKAQFFREAHEAATGTGSMGRFLQDSRPDAVPPFAERTQADAPMIEKQKAGFQPDTRSARRELNEDLADVIERLVEYPTEDWKSEFEAGDTRLDYEEWVEHQRDARTPRRMSLTNLQVDPALSREVADWYAQAEHQPEAPAVRASYDAFKRETLSQFEALQAAGYVMEPWKGAGEPYKNSAEAVADIRDNKHLWFFQTEKGFGSDPSGQPSRHPLLDDAGVEVNGEALVYNDVFRAVHDMIGHGLKGNQFGPRGEFNAWRDHAETYSQDALPAMSAETLAQNSWVNFGPHLRNPDGSIPKKGDENFVPLAERPFADQKATIVPAGILDRALNVARGSDMLTPARVSELAQKSAQAHAQDQGSTMDLRTGQLLNDEPVYVVSIYPERGVQFQGPEVPVNSLENFIQTNSDLLQQPENSLGTFFDEGTGTSDVDVVVATPDRNLAVALGERFNQKSIWDAANKEAIETGGTGERVDTGIPETERLARAREELGRQDSQPDASDTTLRRIKPRTNAGKALASDRGYTFGLDDFDGGSTFELEFRDQGAIVGALNASLIDADTANVSLVFVDPKYRRQGVAEALYREFATELQNRGVTRLTGATINKAPFDLRRKVFGDFESVALVTRERVEVGPRVEIRAPVEPEVARELLPDVTEGFPAAGAGTVEPVSRVQPGIAFQPKRKPDFASKKEQTNPPLVAKAWILPDGEFVPLRGLEHENFVADNIGKLNKLYKVPKLMAGEKIGPVTKHGFVRMTYERNSGRLNIEAGESGWTKPIRDQIFSYVVDHLDSIDNMTVSLFDKKGKLTKQDSAQLFLIDEDAAKLDNLPFITKERTVSPRRGFQPSFIQEDKLIGYVLDPGVKSLDEIGTGDNRVQILYDGMVGTVQVAEIAGTPGGVPTQISRRPFRDMDAALKHLGVTRDDIRDPAQIEDKIVAWNGGNLEAPPSGAIEALNFEYNESPPLTLSDTPDGLSFVETGEEAYHSAWVTRSGDAYQVEGSVEKFYHDDSISAFSEFGSEVGDSNTFQFDTGAMRISNLDSRARINDYGGSLGISVSRKPTSSQLSYLDTILAAENSDGPAITNVGVDVTDRDGAVLASKSFNTGNRQGQGALRRFLRDPFRSVASMNIDRISGFKPAALEFDLGELDAVKAPGRADVRARVFPEAKPVEYRKHRNGRVRKDDFGAPIPVLEEYKLEETARARRIMDQGGTREDVVNDFAGSLKGLFEEYQNVPGIMDGLNWYEDTRNLLRERVGDDWDLMAQALAATSPGTAVDVNFQFAVDAYNGFKQGKFDGLIKKYNEGVAKLKTGELRRMWDEDAPRGGAEPNDETLLSWWVEKHDLKPRRDNGKLFGFHGLRLLQVFTGRWLENNQGPKVRQFYENLAGKSFAPTIDIWIARQLHRLGNEGVADGAWRIMAEAETGVSQKDFTFGQDVFNRAAQDLGIKPDALQAFMWFLEKDIWGRRGWTKEVGRAKSSFADLLRNVESEEGFITPRAPQQSLDLASVEISAR